MKRLLVSFLILFLSLNKAMALDLVLPKDKKTITNSNYAFFCGKVKKNGTLSINDDGIYVAPNGAFAHSVKLKEGENRIAVKSLYNTKIYKIYKNPKQKNTEPVLEEFSPKYYRVLSDNTPLRKTPVDFGMNRISHLFEGTNLIINGQKGEFYRVFLSKNKEGWIAKSAVEETSEPPKNVKFIAVDNKTYKNASVHTIEFNEKLPYTIEENDKEILFRVYNPYVSDDSVYTINIRKFDKYYYKTTSSNGVYVFKTSKFPYCENGNLEDLTITIDPGHGGSELGAIGCLGDKEKDINLKIAEELKNILCIMGANVLMTRECDGYISLEDRIKIAKENDSNIFVSIHLNSIPDIKMDIHKNRGTSVYYYNPNSKELAKNVLESVTSNIKTRNDGLKTASFAVIRPTDYVAILVETAYMTNPLDSVIYKSDNFPADAAKGIANGILNYVNNNQ